MNRCQRMVPVVRGGVLPACVAAVLLTGCGPSYHDLRKEGQSAMLEGAWGPARILFQQADEAKPRRAENLHDMGVCSVMLAKDKFAQMNYAAAMREIDAAVNYYSQAINELPGHVPSLEGKNIALELKGQFAEALKHTEWAVQFVGPSAKQYLFLARELEERGDLDGAFLRYRQAVAVEPKSAEAHVALAKFLIANRNEAAGVQHLQMAHRLEPQNAWVMQQLQTRGELPSDRVAQDTRTP